MMGDMTQDAPAQEVKGYTVDQAAARAGVSRRTIYRAISDGSLRSELLRGRRVITAKALASWKAPISRRRNLIGQ